ncbi:MAG: T9SS type A sorting domain-containing protein [Syntrophothermus sp.]
MKYLIIFLLFFVNVYPQQWIRQNEIKIPYGEPQKVIVVNDNVWFVKNSSQIWKTEDGGLSFSKIIDELSREIIDIYFFNEKLIVVFKIGTNYISIISSSNFGESFTEVKDSIYLSKINKIQFIDDKHAWSIGSNGRRDLYSTTSDGGETWITGGADGINNVHYLDSLNGIMFFVNCNYIRRTYDGGKNWIKMYFPDSVDHIAMSFFPMDSIVYLKGYRFYKFNYKNNLLETSFDLPFPVELLATISKRENIIVLVQNDGKKIFTSFDYGYSWNLRYAPDVGIRNYKILSNGSITALDDNGSVYKSNNLGLSWECITYPLVLPFGIYFIDEKHGWIYGSNILKTSNGGLDWELIYTKNFQWTLYFINQYKGFMYEKYDKGYFLKTSDGGYNWDTLFLNEPIRDIYFVDSLKGFAIGDTTLLKTLDGGDSWTRENGVHNLYLYSMNFCSPKLGFISGFPNGLRTIDGGSTWYPDYKLIGESVFFIDSLTGIKGNRLNLSRTTDGGESYNTLIEEFQSDNYFSSLHFIDEKTGYVFYGSKNYLMKTSDKGATWDTIFSDKGFQAVQFLRENLGWSVDDKGEIFKYTDEVTSNKGDENKIVNNFTLSQNYPNPFNPTTTIKYSIPKQNYVSLKVYDLLGNEVAQLVNEEKPAGKYEVSFNASGLSSGVYFYKINSGEFSQVKKLLLLK